MFSLLIAVAAPMADAQIADEFALPRPSFGGVFAHITFNAHRRLIAIDALRRLGVNVEGFGDPMEYEETRFAVAEADPRQTVSLPWRSISSMMNAALQLNGA